MCVCSTVQSREKAQVPSRQRHGDRLKERLLDAMGSASKRIDDDTEALVPLAALRLYALG